jgi:RNA polymerase sigma factor (sigma-70 family)
MAMLVENRELLARFRAGDPHALDQVYRRYARHVASALRSGFMYSQQGQPTHFPGIHSPFELESMVQEVFSRAFSPEARMRYDGLRPYAGFLYGIARNVALDELRRRARRPESVEPMEVLEQYQAAGRASAGAPATSTTGSIEEDMDARRARELVTAFLDRECDARDRRLYELRYDHDLSQEAAAQEAGLTRIQIRRWESKFRQRLLRYLKRADYVR